MRAHEPYSFSVIVANACLCLCVVSSAIVELIPNAIVMRNQIPKSYLHYDLYCNLIPNEDDNLPYFH